MNNVLNYSMLRQKYNKIPKWRVFKRRRFRSKLRDIELDMHNQIFDELTSDFFSFIISIDNDSNVLNEYVSNIHFTKYYLTVDLNDAIHTRGTYYPSRHTYVVENDDIVYTVDHNTRLNQIIQLSWQVYQNITRSIYIKNIKLIVDEYLF